MLSVLGTAGATAQTYGNPYPSSYYNNQSVQYGLNLPQMPVSNGSDEIRAADGTTCKSSISGNGPMLDVGILGNQDFSGAFASGTVFGRVTMPLGQQPKRIDCSKIYQLELERLQHELRLVRMGMSGKSAGVNEGRASWQTDGWSDTPASPAGKSRLMPAQQPAARQPSAQPASSADVQIAREAPVAPKWSLGKGAPAEIALQQVASAPTPPVAAEPALELLVSAASPKALRRSVETKSWMDDLNSVSLR